MLPASLFPLRQHAFRVLFAGRLVSVAGSTVAPVALAFAVLDLGGSATALGVVLAAGIVPQVVLLLVGGVIADRLPRGRVMVASNVVSAAAQATSAVLLITGEARLWHLAAAAMVSGCATAFFAPAAQGVVPQTVPPEQLQPANALLRLNLNVMKVLGPALGGVLVAVTGPGYGIAWDALTFALAAVILSRLRVALPPCARTSFVRELRDGWTEFWSRTWLWSLVLQYCLVNIAWVSGFQVLGPVVAHQRLGGPAAWGLVVSGLAAGLVAGALLVLWFKPRRPLLFACLGTFTKALPLAALALVDDVALLVCAAVVAGLGTEIFVVGFTATMQDRVPGACLSRVSSYDMLFGTALMPLGYVVAGPASAALGSGATLWLAASVICASTAMVMLVPDVTRLTRRDPARDGALSPAVQEASPQAAGV